MKMKKLLVLSLSTILLASCGSSTVTYDRTGAVKLLDEYSKHDLTETRKNTKTFYCFVEHSEDSFSEIAYDLNNKTFKTRFVTDNYAESDITYWKFYKDGKYITGEYNDIAKSGEYEETDCSEANWNELINSLIDEVFTHLSNIYSDSIGYIKDAPTGGKESFTSTGEGNINFSIENYFELKTENFIPTYYFDGDSSSEFALNRNVTTPPDLTTGGWKRKGEKAEITRDEFFTLYDYSLSNRGQNIYELVDADGSATVGEEKHEFSSYLDLNYRDDGTIDLTFANYLIPCGFTNINSCKTYIISFEYAILSQSGTFKYFTEGNKFGIEFIQKQAGVNNEVKFTFDTEGLIHTFVAETVTQTVPTLMEMTFTNYRCPIDIEKETFFMDYSNALDLRATDSIKYTHGIGVFLVAGEHYDQSFDITEDKDNEIYYANISYLKETQKVEIAFTSMNAFSLYIDNLLATNPGANVRYCEDDNDFGFYISFYDSELSTVINISMWFNQYGYSYYNGVYTSSVDTALYVTEYLK